MKSISLALYRIVDFPRASSLLCLLFLVFLTLPSHALVKHDTGRLYLLGVQLLQGAENEDDYFYVPQYPRLAVREDGGFELLAMKYINADNKSSGGLFHALVEFTLPEETIAELNSELEKVKPGAKVVGPVPLMQAVEDGNDGVGSFEVISSIFSDQEEGGLTRKVITSGKAPLTPGSKAVVAARLNADGATLLWNSLEGGTSDVSVAIHAYYEAQVQAYNAKVTAKMDTIYQHMSKVSSFQQGYTKRQMRKISDDLHREGLLKIEVFDRSKGLGVDAKAMDGILQLVTDKLTELMFDSKVGWAKDPSREVAVEAGQIKGRQKRGWFGRVFGGPHNTKYYSDNQYVMKNRKDIRSNQFQLLLDKKTTIRVPVDTAGNLGGLYAALGENSDNFRVVNLSDADFQIRDTHFQVDGDYIDAFKDTINFVSVNFRKIYKKIGTEKVPEPVTKTLHFTHEDIVAGNTMKSVSFARLGRTNVDWIDYEYQVLWSLRNQPTIKVPKGKDKWLRSQDAAISLVPPFEKQVVEVDADRLLFNERGVSSGKVVFATVFLGKPQVKDRLILRKADAESINSIALYHDRGTPIASRTSWYGPDGSNQGAMQAVEGGYLFLTAPIINADADADAGAEASDNL